MKFLIQLFILSLVTSFATSSSKADDSNGQEVGNGGGVICISGICKTLTEAGLKLVPEFQGVWIPDVSHYTDVRNTLARDVALPLSTNDLLYQRIFGRVDHFRKVDVIDKAKLESIRKYYLELVKSGGFELDPNTFQVVAFSSDDTATPALTYLLPEFFKLTKLQQAQILIHEGLYRGRKTSDLKYVLQFENTIQVLTKFECNSEIGRRACVDQQILAYRLGIWNKSDMIGGLIQKVFSTEYDEGNVKQSLGKLIIRENSAHLLIDHGALLKFAVQEPRLPYMFSRIQRIDLKFDRTVRLQRPSNFVFSPDNSWPTMFLNCTSGQQYYECGGYSFADVEKVEIILPE